MTETGQVAILLGRGDGTLQSPTYYNVDQSSAYAIATADFNADGNVDLAVADRLANNITVFLGNGDGTFREPQAFPTTAQPTSVLIGDFNNDGSIDLLVCDSPYVSVLLGNGDGTFQSPTDTSPTIAPVGIALGDFNGDGNLDVASVGASDLTILIGLGDGTFANGMSYAAGIAPESVAVADFNGDGKLDMAVADFLGSNIYVFIGSGDGVFQLSNTYSAAFPWPIVATDVNGDGKLDMLVPTAGQGTSRVVSILLGKGNGRFGPISSYSGGIKVVLAGSADFNGDHHPDLVLADELGSAINVLLNTGTASFSPTTPLGFSPQLIGTTSTPQNVTLTNTGTKALSIAGKKVSGPFQLAGGTTCESSVAPGAKCTLSVVFTPKVIGTTGGLLSISDSASSKPQVIELSGSGTVISVSPTLLNFGTQKVGTKSSPQNVTVTNTGSTTVSVTSVTITGANSKDYSQTNTCGKQIGPGGTCTISLTFVPTKTGTRTALVQINDNGGGGSQGASLTGVGD